MQYSSKRDSHVNSDQKFDVIILGGGIIGLCSAYYLSRDGARVAVIDKGEIGHGSSHHNAGYVCPSHFIPLAAPGVFKQGLKWMLNPTSPLYIKPRMNIPFLEWTLKFAQACNDSRARGAMPLLRDLLVESKKLYEELAKVPGIDMELTKRGLTELFRTEKGKQKCMHEAELAEELGIEAQLLDRDGLQHLDPEVLFHANGGLYFPGDCHLSPAKLVSSLAAYLTTTGVQILSNTNVTNFGRNGNRLAFLDTSAGRIHAEEFVLASGAWSPIVARTLGLRMLLEAGKGYSVTLPSPKVNVRLPYILTERRVAVTPFENSIRFAGTMEIAGLTTEINRPRVEAIMNAVPLYFSNIPRPQSSQGEVWAGLRPVTPDGLPYLGRFAKIPNLIAATGHAMIGISMATATGAVACDLITSNRTKFDLTLTNPDRYS